MAYQRVNNKRPMKSFMVASGDQALVAGGVTLMNSSTGVVNIADGQLGIFSADFNSTVANDVVPGTYDITNAASIRIIQGTADSADPSNSQYKYPLYPRPFAASAPIAGTTDITVTKQAYEAPTNTVWVVGDTNALATGGITATDETSYSIGISYRGRIIDEMYNRRNTQHTIVSTVTPDFTTLGTAKPVDWIIQSLVEQTNSNSYAIRSSRPRFQGNDPVVALALNLSGTGGTAVAALAAGTFLPIQNTANGVRGITPDAALVATLQAALPAGSSILTADTTTGGTVTGGEADVMAFVALDRKTVSVDKVAPVKIDVNIGLRSGFDATTVYSEKTSRPGEGQGLGRQLDLEWKATEGQNLYTLSHQEDPVINFPSPVDTTATYNKYTVHHKTMYQMDTFNATYNPMKEIILIPTTDTTTVAAFDAAFGAWLTSAGTGITS
jgi:hypothetical protein